MLKRLIQTLGFAALLSTTANQALASASAGSGSGSAPPHGPHYTEVQPAVLVNFGGPGRIKYLKLEISIRMADGSLAEHVTHHMPLIRNNLILLFSKQTEETVSSVEGKEAMRQAALEEVRKILKEEENLDIFTPPPPPEGEEEKKEEDPKKAKHGHKKDKPGPAVEDLFFTNFIIQR